MQAIKFLDNLIVQRNIRDEEWIELKWNPVVEQMWQGFQLSKSELEEIKDYMERQKEEFISWGGYTDLQYAREHDVCGWDIHRYMDSVDNTFKSLVNIIECRLHNI
jgi:hypothetical protein